MKKNSRKKCITINYRQRKRTIRCIVNESKNMKNVDVPRPMSEMIAATSLMMLSDIPQGPVMKENKKQRTIIPTVPDNYITKQIIYPVPDGYIIAKVFRSLTSRYITANVSKVFFNGTITSSEAEYLKAKLSATKRQIAEILKK